MRASAYNEQGDEYMLKAIHCNKRESLKKLNDECSHKVYKALRLAQSARTHLEKHAGRKYAILHRQVFYGDWNPILEFI